jgi:hypothetical protein
VGSFRPVRTVGVTPICCSDPSDLSTGSARRRRRLFCKSNRRIAALVTAICLALLIFCLIGRQVRRSLAEQGETTVAGLYAGRPAIPTGRLILAAMKIIPGRGQDPPVIRFAERPGDN